MKKLLPFLFLSFSAFLMAQDAQEIIRRTEEAMRGSSSLGEMEMRVVKKEWERSLRLKFWEKGKEKTLVVILTPAKERGMATLKINNKVWNYLPSIERTIQLPPSMMSQSWMGSHFTNDDLVRESSLQRDYTASLLREDSETYYLELIPRPEAAVVWGKIEFDVDKKTFLPLKGLFFDEKGKKIRRIIYSDIRLTGGRYFPFLWTLYPEKDPGEKTEIKVLAIQFDVVLSESLFSLRSLKELVR
ncbi:MAG: outer membrane lipoprotein-sorting protein [Candidatus Aminicenantales bacterium]